MPSRLVLMLASIAVVLPAALAAGTPGDGNDGVCDGRVASRFERAVLAGQRFREQFGMPSDRAYVESVLRDPRNRRLRPEQNVVVTPAERRYMDDRMVVEDHIYHVTEYVARHARGADGGVSIEDDYPGGAYVAARFTHDLERHAAFLRGVPERVRVIGVRFTEDEIARQVDRFTRAVLRKLRRDGIAVVSVSDDLVRNGVEAEVISARPDAAGVVAGMFGAGPPVHVTVIAGSTYREVCGRARSYRVGRDGRVLRVAWATNSAYRRLRVEARETPQEVRIAVLEHAPNGPVTLVSARRRGLVRLKSPLGSRRVVDAETGRRLRRLHAVRGSGRL